MYLPTDNESCLGILRQVACCSERGVTSEKTAMQQCAEQAWGPNVKQKGTDKGVLDNSVDLRTRETIASIDLNRNPSLEILKIHPQATDLLTSVQCCTVDMLIHTKYKVKSSSCYVLLCGLHVPRQTNRPGKKLWPKSPRQRG